MVKKELLSMRQLNATPEMIEIAQKDIPQKTTVQWGDYSYQVTRQENQLYMRCCIENDILKVTLYYPDNLRVEGHLPTYEVYIDRNASQFITYDRIRSKWRKSKVDRLDWPEMPYAPNVWASAADAEMVSAYLNSEKQGYEAVLSYQQKLREEARIQRYKKETDAWDADMALVPALPKDWDRWVNKVGIPQNYIFYEYKRGGAKTGYCTYCEKDVPIKGKPRHNKTGRCSCCRHEITYKAIGKLGWRLDTEEVCVYLIQPYLDGFVIREFWAGKQYLKKDIRSPKMYCTEHWRTISDANLVRRPYYWGVYNSLRCAGSPVSPTIPGWEPTASTTPMETNLGGFTARPCPA